MISAFYGTIISDITSTALTQSSTGKSLIDDKTGKPFLVASFSIALPRHGYNREKKVNDKTYTSDAYKVKVTGQNAEYMTQYGKKGQKIIISGYLFEEEYITTDKKVQISKTNPLYGLLANYVNAPYSPIGTDAKGDLYICANFPVKHIVIDAVHCEIVSDRERSGNSDNGFNPPSDLNSGNNSNFANVPFNPNFSFGGAQANNSPTPPATTNPVSNFAPPTQQQVSPNQQQVPLNQQQIQQQVQQQVQQEVQQEVQTNMPPASANTSGLFVAVDTTNDQPF